jgi:hypothetical protein
MFKKILAAALAALMLAFCFVGCNPANSETPTDEPTEAPTNKPTVATAVKVIYPSGDSRKPALKIQDAIMDLKGASLETMNFCTLTADDKTEDDGTFEILVGHTNRAISGEAKALLTSYLDFAVLYKGNKIAISANNEARLIAAVEFVLEKLSLKDDKVVYNGGEKHVEVYTEYEMKDMSIGGVAIEEFKDQGSLISIRAEIFCEKASHKGIIVGKGGEELKRVGSYARADLEAIFGTKVFLDLWVKVKENWRDSQRGITDFGYTEE